MLVVVLVLEIRIVLQSDQQNKLVAGHRSPSGHGITMHRGRGRGRFPNFGAWAKYLLAQVQFDKTERAAPFQLAALIARPMRVQA